MKNYDVKKAMIMAAGVGSRLAPLTNDIPKPLVPILNRPIMDIILDNLNKIGINEVVANTFYYPEQIVHRYEDNNLGINFNYIHEDTLSGTAGGVKKCQFFFDEGEDFVVLSADGLSNADLLKGIKTHKDSGAIATIGVKKVSVEDVPHFGVVVTDDEGFITEFQEKPNVEDAKSDCINTGIYIFNYKIFEYIPSDTFYDFAKNVFPQLLEERAINTFIVDEYWSDIGTIDQYMLSTQDVFEGKCKFNHEQIIRTDSGSYIAGNTVIPESVKFIGNSVIGDNCIIGENCTIENSIIWNDVRIDSGLNIKNSIIASNSAVHVDLDSQVLGANQIINRENIKI